MIETTPKPYVRPDYYAEYRVDVPEGESGPWKVERFHVDEDGAGLFNMQQLFNGRGGRNVRPGTYTRLSCHGRGVVMSDTDAEIRDHMEVLRRVEHPSCKRVLIHGLGIGMVLKHTLAQPHVAHVDVVEISEDVIRLVGPHYADDRLTVHCEDAYSMTWPANTRWDVAWHDIWDSICSDNLEGMGTLNRKYARRAGWQGCWCIEQCRAIKRRDRSWYG